MAFKSAFTGAKIEELLVQVNTWKVTPSSRLEGVTEANILGAITAQGLINKINSVTGNIVFTKYVDAQKGAGNSTEQ